ncbi:VWA domain-containing protein [Allorhodopirellula heiligendammensis]|uniref:von Willebrand factor type A domain protein n=1 Tax=Allorhodopirellula heiligendammensis TaxID=2714739 RepID=A0A5C6C7P4_9BACT|nr:VWA domain-containing protein [Allorhodopirellula heiligendammensis]TWU19521.1 von Willebrand factor type A domain protein [Allorhodopirellula heiligendammensis]|tara:strand:+ start:426 stop:3068 length:2643 start_codon:yes stop_codon:yes gene_type:complete
MIPLEWTRPWFLLALIPILVVILVYFRRSLSDFPPRQRMISLFVRVVIATLLVAALAGLTLLRDTQEQFVILLTDDSLSIDDDAQQQLDEFVRQAVASKGGNELAMLSFASSAGPIHSLSDEASIPPPRAVGKISEDDIGNEDAANADEEKQRRDGTNVAAAIEAAAGYIPPGYVPQIVLVTDGNQTAGDAVGAASQSRVPITTIALPSMSEPEIQVAAVDVPAEVREGEPFNVGVVVQSNHDDEGLVEVYRGDHKVISETKQFAKGENRFQFQQSIERDRLAAFTVRVSGVKEDTLLDNNSDIGLVYSAGKPRVLIIESDPNLIRELAYALEDEGIMVDVRPPQGMPESLADLQNYECLMLSNVPATALSQTQMQIARTWVQELGGGLIMLGGEQSFGLGGYYKSALEDVLPVRSDFEKEKEKPSLAMVLVIDKSGSMQGDPIEMAKSAARAAVELLGRRDKVAVLAFDGETFVISDMQPASSSLKISDEIARIEAGGGTSMYPAMEMSFSMLQAVSAKLKHVILLTDGVSTPGDFEGMAQQMASLKMTVSTVAAGSGADTELLEQIARTGKGRYYFTDDPAQVPQIFAKETVTASKSAIDEQPFLPVVIRATHALADLDMESAPFLLGYVMTRPKPTSEVILATEKGDPLLAWWRYGLGMTAAFTSDAKSRWAAEWMTWPGYGKFWTQVIRQVMRKSDTRGIEVHTVREADRIHVDIDAANEVGQFLNDAEVELTVIDPNLKRQLMTVAQSAPGRYTGDFELPAPGSYHMEINVQQNGQTVYRQSRGVMRGYSDELRIRPTDETLLKQIAEVSGGRYNPVAAELFRTTDAIANRPTPLWPWLLTAAAFLLILDVALRRIDFEMHWSRWFGFSPATLAE